MILKELIDILCVGEVLIDFIGHQAGAQINNTRDYHRYLGGSPTNVAMNSSRLGLKTIIAATVGDDGFGAYVFKRLKEVGVITDCMFRFVKTNPQALFLCQDLRRHQSLFLLEKRIIISKKLK